MNGGHDDDEVSAAESDEPKEKAEEDTPNRSSKKASKPEETVFECGKCKAIFTNLTKCNEHMASAHHVSMVSVNENFICSKPDCGFKCNDAETLKKHVLKEHPQVLANKHKCSECDEEFESAEALESHSKKTHKANRYNSHSSFWRHVCHVIVRITE